MFNLEAILKLIQSVGGYATLALLALYVIYKITGNHLNHISMSLEKIVVSLERLNLHIKYQTKIMSKEHKQIVNLIKERRCNKCHTQSDEAKA